MMTVFKIVLILIAVVVVGVVALILFALHKESNYSKNQLSRISGVKTVKV